MTSISAPRRRLEIISGKHDTIVLVTEELENSLHQASITFPRSMAKTFFEECLRELEEKA